MNDIQRLQRIYRAVGAELRTLLYSLDKPNPPGAAKASESARELVKDLNRAVEEWSGDAIPKAYGKGARTARTALEIIGKKRKKNPVVDRARILQDDLMLALIRANNSIPVVVDRYLAASMMAARAAAQVQEFSFSEAEDKIAAMARQTVQADETRKTLTAKVKDYLRSLIEDDEFIEINGRTYRMTKYAEMVGRTVLREAQTAATLDLCSQYDNDLVQVSDHQTDCAECQQFEGNIYSISGSHPDYPPLEDEPPYHPNCEHSLLPTSDIAIRTEKQYGMGGPMYEGGE